MTDSGLQSDTPTAEFITATGGTVTNSPCGNFKVHTFTGPGTFAVSALGNASGSTTVDYLVGAGGGSGFTFTINSENTGISSVTDISLGGEGYAINEVLSVDDTTVGNGGGSGFQYTVTNVGFAESVTVAQGGNAFELADTLILGPVGGDGVAQGTGLSLTIASIVRSKALELTQTGNLVLGETGTSQFTIQPDGAITAQTYSVSAAGAFNVSTLVSSGPVSGSTGSFSGTANIGGLLTATAGVTVSGATSNITDLTTTISDGGAATPSLAFNSSNTTGLFHQASNVMGVTVGGTQIGSIGSTGPLFKQLNVDSSINPAGSDTFFTVESTTPKLSIGATATKLEINDSTTISTAGGDIDVPLTFDTKGGGNFTFKGGANVDFIVDDGTTEVFKLETSSGTATFSGNLDAGKLRIRQNVIANNSTGANRAFGEVLGLSVTGT